MWNLLWPMLMVVGANTVYNICAKSVPDKLNSFAALTINYLVAAGLSLALFYLTSGGGKSLVQEMVKTNWALWSWASPWWGWNWGTSSSTGRGGR